EPTLVKVFVPAEICWNSTRTDDPAHGSSEETTTGVPTGPDATSTAKRGSVTAKATCVYSVRSKSSQLAAIRAEALTAASAGTVNLPYQAPAPTRHTPDPEPTLVKVFVPAEICWNSTRTDDPAHGSSEETTTGVPTGPDATSTAK